MTAFATSEAVAPLSPLHGDRAFRRFWAASTVSVFGDEVSALASPLIALDASPAQPRVPTSLACGMLFLLASQTPELREETIEVPA